MLAFDLFVYARGHMPERAREHDLVDRLDRRRARLRRRLLGLAGLLTPGSQYLAGYLLERSLSLDNIFVFAVILAYFAVPGEQVQAQACSPGASCSRSSCA